MSNLNLPTLLKKIKTNHSNIVIDFIIVNSDSTKILIQKRSKDRKLFPDCWEFTGGHLEEDEEIEDCINREMNEETGMELVKILGLAHQFVWEDNTINLQFLVKASGDFMAEEGKISEYRWINNNEIDVILENNQTDNQIYKGAFYAFGFLDGLKNTKT